MQASRGFQPSTPSEIPPARGALSRLSDAVEAFLLSRTVGGCTSRTVALYRTVLGPLVAALGDEVQACTALAVQTYLSTLRSRVKPTTAHLALRYAHLTKPDVSAKFRRASPLDNLRAGR